MAAVRVSMEASRLFDDPRAAQANARAANNRSSTSPWTVDIKASTLSNCDAASSEPSNRSTQAFAL